MKLRFARAVLTVLLVFRAAAGFAQTVDAQNYPNRPVHVIVPLARRAAVRTFLHVQSAKSFNSRWDSRFR